MATFSGVIRVKKGRAQLETAHGLYTLVPYPKATNLSEQAVKQMGMKLFGYQNGQEATIDGTRSGDVIFKARLAEGVTMIQDVRLAPESKDRFSAEIEQHFRKDTREIAIKLNDAGIRTVSALYHRIKNNYESEVRAFSKYLGVPSGRIKEFIEALESNADNSLLVRASTRYPVRRGVNLKALRKIQGVPVTKKPAASPPKFPQTAFTPGLPSKVDLTVHMTPVKNQGQRGTCVAHAAAACLEAELIRSDKAKLSLDLSEQYLYWACKSIDGSPNSEGTFIEYAVEILLNGVRNPAWLPGIAAEKDWPYDMLPREGNESQGPPPASLRKIFKTGKQFRAINYTRLKHNSISALKRELASGRCVGLSVYTYHFWTDDFAWREGNISLPLNIEPDGAHAVCLVGYRDLDASHGDGYFIFKNSWDRTWGYGRPDPGYGSLPYRYVLKEAIEAYSVDA